MAATLGQLCRSSSVRRAGEPCGSDDTEALFIRVSGRSRRFLPAVQPNACKPASAIGGGNLTQGHVAGAHFAARWWQIRPVQRGNRQEPLASGATVLHARREFLADIAALIEGDAV